MKRNIKGFTLVELMVIVGLIAILLSVILVSLNKSRMRTRDNIRIADIQVIRLALEEYRSACGVFPETLELDANNGRRGTCPGGLELSDFLAQIPEAPDRSDPSLLSTSVVPLNSRFNGYFYAGLSAVSNGPCYEYHLAAELEFAQNNSQNSSPDLEEDHDFEYREGDFNQGCGSTTDFGTTNPATDDLNGLYDFRSVNKH